MTVQQIIRGPVVDAPHPARRRGELLDVADVHEGMGWIDPNDMFVSWNCLEAGSVDVCATDTTPAKTFQSPSLVDGIRFAVYLGGACKPLGADAEENIDRVFDLRESRAVEKQLQSRLLVLGSAVSGSPVNAAHALALMENALGDAYAGIGTIHMSPLMATVLLQNQLLVEQGGRYYTQLGTNVVVGTGYSSTVMYGTGAITIYRSARVLVESPDTANNVVNILAERAYVVVGDCVALVLSNVPAPTAGGTSGGGGTPTPQNPVDVETGADTVSGPGGTWTPPSGNLRNVQVVVTSGSVEVDGDELSAPHTASFDADTNETLSPPSITASGSNDEAVVTWVVVS